MVTITATGAGEGCANMPRALRTAETSSYTALLRPMGPEVGRALGERLERGQRLSELLYGSLTGVQRTALRTTLRFRGLRLSSGSESCLVEQVDS